MNVFSQGIFSSHIQPHNVLGVRNCFGFDVSGEYGVRGNHVLHHSVTLCISDNSLPFSAIELSLIIAETSVNVTDDETDIERISPTIQRTEVGVVSTPPHS